MCGINGFNWLNSKLIEKMNEALRHRGPDGEGTFLEKGLSLGHRRLAIIDLSEKGKQPMMFRHGAKKAVIVFNGEIYNFQEIRKELEEKGYKFKSKTDTEVILASYLEWGTDCVKKFNGMWAFCVYDPQKRILFLSRDRVGKKPLHYYFDGEEFVFSSEIKGILESGIKREISKNSVDIYLSMGFIPSPHSIYVNVYKLEPATNLIFDLKGKKLQKQRYWNLPNYNPVYDKEKLIAEGKIIFENAVKSRLISDVPLGAFLSGGMDSSVIVGEMAKTISSNKLNTFSIGFEGKYDETSYIEIAKNRFGTIHHHKYFKEEDFKNIGKEIFYYYDEPFADISMFPSFFLSNFTRQNLTVSLSGDGGDEVFGGYPRYKIAEQLEILRKWPVWMRKLASALIPSKRVKEGIRLSFFNKEDFYAEARQEIYKPEFVKNLLREKLKFFLEKTNGNLQEAVRLMDIDIYTLPENFLLKVDRASMANSLEVRCPLLDYRLIEYSMKIPSKWKSSASDYKILMKEMFKDILPKEIINRSKKGFTPPILEWMNSEGYDKEIAEALAVLQSKGILDENWVDFYRNILPEKGNDIYTNYKIRLLFLKRWHDCWVK